uniref:Uncharacterized protein n=2 Tax=Pan TaxID=9596 RepID=G2HGM6_PANTR|nr:hypothetical protein [Pan troglodytes]
MCSGTANPRGPRARSLAEGVGKGRPTATARGGRGGWEEEGGLKRGERARAAPAAERPSL